MIKMKYLKGLFSKAITPINLTLVSLISAIMEGSSSDMAGCFQEFVRLFLTSRVVAKENACRFAK